MSSLHKELITLYDHGFIQGIISTLEHTDLYSVDNVLTVLRIYWSEEKVEWAIEEFELEEVNNE